MAWQANLQRGVAAVDELSPCGNPNLLTCFVLPKWVINRIDLIRRRFLWGRMEGQGRGVSLMNWDLVCTPKQCGGLGAPNLEIRNIFLIMRWWWKA